LIFAFAMLGCLQLAMIGLVVFINGKSPTEVVDENEQMTGLNGS
jgi:hypothetical protein